MACGLCACTRSSQTLELGPRVGLFVDEVVGSAVRRESVVAAVAAERVVTDAGRRGRRRVRRRHRLMMLWNSRR